MAKRHQILCSSKRARRRANRKWRRQDRERISTGANVHGGKILEQPENGNGAIVKAKALARRPALFQSSLTQKLNLVLEKDKP